MIESLLKEVLHIAILWTIVLVLCLVAIPIVSKRNK